VIEGDDAVHRGLDELAIPLFAFAQAPFRLMLEQSDFDLRRDVALLEGLEDIAEGLRGGGAPKGVHIRVGGEVDDGNVTQRLNAFGGLDAVHRAGQADVHQHEVRSQMLGRLDGVFAVGRDPD
jgi:hypothetical protein